MEQLLESLLHDAKNRDDVHQQAINEVQDTTSLVTKTPWLRYNRWEKKFAGQDMKELHALTDLPKVTAIEESIIFTTVDKVLHACWEGYHDCVNREWDLLPFWLSLVHRDKEETKPFRSYIAPYTLTRYIGYWQSYIVLCYRMFMKADERLQFTRAQRALLIKIQALMTDYAEDDNVALYELLFKFSVSLICHSDYAKETSSLIYYVGVRGYNVDYKQWRQPQDYTTILAGIQFCMRIIMLEHALPITSRDGFTEDSIETPVDKFCKVREWLIDGGGSLLLRYGTDCRYTI